MLFRSRNRDVGAALLAGLALALGGCGGSDLSTGSIAPYEAANTFYPYGYQDSVVSENERRVVASGSGRASKTRLEKIALTRAAQIGVDQRKHYFKVVTVTHGVACERKLLGSHKRAETPAAVRPTVTLDVVYADTPAGPDFRESKASLAEYKTALDADTTSADPSQIDELKTQCGGA